MAACFVGNPQGSVQTMVNGRYFDSTGYELDGTVNQDPILGIIVVNPTMDSVNEVKQANQDYDSEFGYMGAGLIDVLDEIRFELIPWRCV